MSRTFRPGSSTLAPIATARQALRQEGRAHPHARPLPRHVRYEPQPTRRIYSSNPQELAEEFIDAMTGLRTQEYVSVSIVEVGDGEFCLAVWEPIFGVWDDKELER